MGPRCPCPVQSLGLECVPQSRLLLISAESTSTGHLRYFQTDWEFQPCQMSEDLRPNCCSQGRGAQVATLAKVSHPSPSLPGVWLPQPVPWFGALLRIRCVPSTGPRMLCSGAPQPWLVEPIHVNTMFLLLALNFPEMAP
jgi:hypothetical protein